MIFYCTAQLLQLMTYQHDKNLNDFEIVLSEQTNISSIFCRNVMVYILYIIGYEDKTIGWIQSPNCNCI